MKYPIYKRTVWRCLKGLRLSDPRFSRWCVDHHFFGLFHRSEHWLGCETWSIAGEFRGWYFCNFKSYGWLNSEESRTYLELRLGRAIWLIGRQSPDQYKGVEVFGGVHDLEGVVL